MAKGFLPDWLWHYTNGVGARGILESRTLRGGHLGYMNDSSEVNHAMKLSLHLAYQLLADHPDQVAELKSWINFLTDSPPSSWAPNTFAISFTENPDLLSQWRGYTQGAGGPFCLGFPAAQIEDQCLDQGWRLIKCVYSEADQKAMLRVAIEESLEVARRLEWTDPSRVQRRIYSEVLLVAPAIKHPSFSEEAEWRLVKDLVTLTDHPDRVGFTTRRHTLAPYLEFDLTSDNEPLPNVRWIAGPGPEQTRSNSAMGEVARLADVGTYKGAPSQTPYLP